MFEINFKDKHGHQVTGAYNLYYNHLTVGVERTGALAGLSTSVMAHFESSPTGMEHFLDQVSRVLPAQEDALAAAAHVMAGLWEHNVAPFTPDQQPQITSWVEQCCQRDDLAPAAPTLASQVIYILTGSK